MKNENENTRINVSTDKRKTENAAPSVRQFCNRTKKKNGCPFSRRGKKTICTSGDASNGFLKQPFLPKLEDRELSNPGYLKITAEMDQQFKESLALLMDYYNVYFTPSCTGQWNYDWLVDLDKISHCIGSESGAELCIVKTESNILALQTRTVFETGACLYYLPIMPLYRFIKNKQFRSSRPAVLTLLSACSYLYLKAGVPMYTDPGSYLDYEYDILLNWTQDEGELPEDKNSDLKELKEIVMIGQVMERKFRNIQNLAFLESRINMIIPIDQFDRYCLDIGKQTLLLLHQFPEENIFRLVQEYDHNPYDYDHVTRMDQYISFTGTSEGGISDMLLDMVNNELAENGNLQEPEIVQVFDGNPIEDRNFFYEQAVFRLLGDVCTVLNNY